MAEVRRHCLPDLYHAVEVIAHPRSPPQALQLLSVTLLEHVRRTHRPAAETAERHNSHGHAEPKEHGSDNLRPSHSPAAHPRRALWDF